jgi:hypothetical protein
MLSLTLDEDGSRDFLPLGFGLKHPEAHLDASRKETLIRNGDTIVRDEVCGPE